MNTTMRDVLVKTYNLENVPEEQQNQMLEKIGSLIFQAILIRVIPMLSEEKQEELEKILATDATPDDLLIFLAKEIPDFKNIVGEEAENFKKESDAIMRNL